MEKWRMENGEWRTEKVELKGETKQNPHGRITTVGRFYYVLHGDVIV